MTDLEASKERNAVLAVVSFANLFGAIPLSGVLLAMPEIGRELSVSIESLAWVMVSYLLVASVCMPIVGRLGDLAGLSRIFLLGFVVAGLASLVCGLSDSFVVLVIARGVQGAGGAMTMAVGPALLTTTFPARQRGKALGTITAAVYLGLTLGPPLGGLLVWQWGWRSVFFAYVPVAAAVVFIGYRYLPHDTPKRGQKFDIAGALALSLGLVLLLLPLALGSKGGWSSWMLPSLGGGAVLMAGFVRIQRKSCHPLMDLTLFRSRTFSLTAFASLCNYVSIFVYVLLVPFFLEEGRGAEASTVGLALACQPLVMALVTRPAGRLSDRTGARWFCVIGLAIMGGGILASATLDSVSSVWTVGLWLAVTGFGTGLFVTPNSSAMMGAAKGSQQGVAGGILAIARNLGMMIGSALAATLFPLFGGHTGSRWGAGDFGAFSRVMMVAGTIALVGAVVSGFQERRCQGQT
jgi:EmrB/QacA subfamily drug resistance transporter